MPTPSPKVLLVSESLAVRRQFNAAYPLWHIEITDFFPDLVPHNDIASLLQERAPSFGYDANPSALPGSGLRYAAETWLS